MAADMMQRAINRKVWEEGRTARREGLTLQESPYNYKTHRYLDDTWHSGWCDEDQGIMSEEV